MFNDRDVAEWRRRFWAAKRENAEREKTLREGTWFKSPVPGNPPVGSW